MIRYLRHSDIDFDAYRRSLNSSDNYRIYAEPWYLDAVTGGCWDCLADEGYSRIMPLPYAWKLGVKIIVQPLFCQQLGVFGIGKDSVSVNDFYKKIKHLPLRSYAFNEENMAGNGKFITRKNFVLSLNESYEALRINFNKNRKRDISRIGRLKTQVSTDFVVQDFVNAVQQEYPDLPYYRSPVFIRLLEEIKNRGLYDFRGLISDGKEIASVLFLVSGRRRILLMSIKSTFDAYRGAAAFLISRYIQENAQQDLLLDFEGSMIPGIARFYGSFGASPKNYPVLSRPYLFF